MLNYVAFYLDPHYLLKYAFGVSSIQRVKVHFRTTGNGHPLGLTHPTTSKVTPSQTLLTFYSRIPMWNHGGFPMFIFLYKHVIQMSAVYSYCFA